MPRTHLLAAALTALLAAPALAQVNNTWVIPRGVLQLGFAPWYTNYDHRFALDGTLQPLGADLSSDSMPISFLPTMVPVQTALRVITGNPSLPLTLGSFKNALDADIRRFPLSAAVGLTDRLSLSLNVPIVTVRMNDRLTVDSSSKQVGWNQALSASGNSAAFGQIQTLLIQLDSAGTVVEANIIKGSYGCPGSAQCAQAHALLSRARSVRDQLIQFTGVQLTGTSPVANAPPLAPLATGVAGQALLAALQSLSADLTAFGAGGVGTSIPLPTTAADSGVIQSILVTPALGYAADSLTMRRRTTIGDIELGLHYGLAQTPSFRAVLNAVVRFPTGNLASPTSYTDLSTGDHQWDIEAGVDAAVEPGETLGLWASASYTAQLPDQVLLRVAPPHNPVTLSTDLRALNRNLGDMVRVAFGPELRLSPEVRVFGSATYFWKGTDSYSNAPACSGCVDQEGLNGPTKASVLEPESGMMTWSFGAGVAYRSTRAHDGERLPIEAGLSYSAAFSGSGGFTPQTASMGLYLKLFYRVFGASPEPAPAEPPAKTPGN